MWAFIVNPVAGNGRGRVIFEKLQKTDDFRELNTLFLYSEYEGHAEEIARELAQDKRIGAIVVVGGDGTMHEVMNGLGVTEIPVGFIPGGSGNDFARGLGIKGSPEAILAGMIRGENLQTYWLGNYIQDEGKPRHFVNSIGFGFDAETAHTANKSNYKKFFNQLRFGTGSYVVAILQVLKTFQPLTLEVVLDGERKVYDNCWLISIGNHPYYGGGMKIMPHAKVQPDKFAVLLVHSVPKWKVLALFLTVFAGKHDKIRGVELIEASELRVTSEGPIYTQVDGQTTTCRSTIISKQSKPIQIMNRNEN